MSALSLSEFLQIDPKEIDVGVTKINSNILLTTYEVELNVESKNIHFKSQKRYTEFQGFYDSLTIRYQNLNFPEFPSKFQLINKNEKRKLFFDNLLRTVQQLACSHNEIKKELLKLIYEFVLGGGQGSEGYVKKSSFNDNSSVNGRIDNSELDKSSCATVSFKTSDDNKSVISTKTPRKETDGKSLNVSSVDPPTSAAPRYRTSINGDGTHNGDDKKGKSSITPRWLAYRV
jgi:hypothetical protein